MASNAGDDESINIKSDEWIAVRPLNTASSDQAVNSSNEILNIVSISVEKEKVLV
jgi:hypothetical protein